MSRFQLVEVQGPRLTWRVVLTVLLIVIGCGAAMAYQAVQGPLEAQMALKQIGGTSADYVVGAWFARFDIVGTIYSIDGLLVALLWLHYFVRLFRYHTRTVQSPEKG